MSKKIAWAQPATVDSPHRNKKRLREEDWEPYKTIIIERRANDQTAKQIQQALEKEGFHVNLTSLNRKLRKWDPKNKKQAIFRISRVMNEQNVPIGPVAGTIFILDGDLEPLGERNEPSADANTSVTPALNYDENRDDPITETIARILLKIKTHGDADEGSFLLEVAEEDVDQSKSDEDSMVNRMLQKLHITQDIDPISGNDLPATNSPLGVAELSTIPQDKTASSLESTFANSALNGGLSYSLKDILATVEDLPNWWTFGQFWSCGGGGDQQFSLLTEVELYDLLGIILEEAEEASKLLIDEKDRTRLVSILKSLNDSFLQLRRRTTHDLLNKATSDLMELSGLEFSGYPRHFLAYWCFRMAIFVPDRTESTEWLVRSDANFEACEDLPAWATMVFITARLAIVQSNDLLTDADADISISVAESVLRDVEQGNSAWHSNVKFLALQGLAVAHCAKGDFAYIKVLERMVAVIRKVPGETYYRVRCRPLLEGLTKIYRRMGSIEKAITCLAEWFHETAPDNSDITLLTELSRSLAVTGRPGNLTASRLIYRYIIRQASLMYHQNAPQILIPIAELGITYAYEYKYQMALKLYERVLDGYLSTVISEADAASRDPSYGLLFLKTKRMAVYALVDRGPVLYRQLQPVVERLLKEHIQHYGGLDHRSTWEAQLLKISIDLHAN